MAIDVSAIPAGFAFDEGGGLWVAYSAGKLARFSPTQLTVSTNTGNPTVPETIITSTDIGYAADVAFYPAPAALPLFDALP